MKNPKIITLLLVALCCGEFKAQDIHFSQVNEAPIMLNPANTGFFDGYIRASGNYRNQWTAFDRAYKTMGLNLDASLFRNKRKSASLGMGLIVFSDKAGAASLGNNQVLLTASGIVKLDKKNTLAVGMYGGASINSANYSKLTYATQWDPAAAAIDPNLPNRESVAFHSYTYSDIGIGAVYEYKKVKTHDDRDDVQSLRLGIAVAHVNRAKQEFGSGSDYRIPAKIVFHGSSRIDIPNRTMAVIPSFVYYYQSPAKEINFGCHIKYRFKAGTKITGQKVERGISFGMYYRVSDALIPQVLLDMGTYAIGVSYDANISAAKKVTKTKGGMEITLRYNWLADALFKRKHEYY